MKLATVVLTGLSCVGLLLSTGCSNPLGDGSCHDVTITVSAGTTPRFDWSPRCSITELVVHSATPPWAWDIKTQGFNGITPPIRYGVDPPGVEDISPKGHADTLTAGYPASVVISRYFATSDGDYLEDFESDFVP
jgi:hypothetical protein